MNRLAIVDFDTYLYRGCEACKTLEEIRPGIFSEVYDLQLGINFIEKEIDRILNETITDKVQLVIGDKENFRKLINPQYKAQRKAKPLMLDKLKEQLRTLYDIDSLPNLEADDTCRIMYEDNNFYPGWKKIIVSVDKDFFSVPCTFHRDLPNQATKLYNITQEEADKHLFKQIIMGDSTDNYKGIKGYGEKKVEEVLPNIKRLDDVKQLFLDNGMTEWDFQKNYQMARIVGFASYNFQTGEVTDGFKY